MHPGSPSSVASSSQGSSGFLPFLPRRGAVVFTIIHFSRTFPVCSVSCIIYTFISFTVHSAPALPAFANPPSRTPHFFLSSFCPGTPPRPRAIPCHLILTLPPSSPSAASRFPPGAETPPRLITEDVSLRPPIRAEPPFPARGMLAQFPHAFPGGALPSRGGGRWPHHPPP
jgi:hypothetical protein